MGLLDVIPVPRAALKLGESDPLSLTFGSDPKIYRASKKGLDTLVQARLLDPESAVRPPAYGPENAAFLGHELAVRDTLVWLTKSARSNDDHRVERWECAAGLAAGGVRPDAIFVYGFGFQCVAGMVEADMGTERGNNRWWTAKFSAYAALFVEESRQTLWDLTGYKRARIVITVPTPARAAWIARQAIEQGEGTLVPSQTWITVRSRLADADVRAPVWLRPTGEESGFLTPTRCTRRRKVKGKLTKNRRKVARRFEKTSDFVSTRLAVRRCWKCGRLR